MTALQQLHSMVGKNENVLWPDKPQLKCFILETIFNPLLPLSIIWALFDGLFIFAIMHGAKSGQLESSFSPFCVVFFVFHLMPVWLYLGGIIFSFLKYKNAAFLVTDKGVYISRGIFSLTFIHKPFMEIARVSLHRGIIDQMLGVGDVVIGVNQNNNAAEVAYNQINLSSIYDIKDYQQVYKLVKQLQQDIYSDVQYPNDLRPPKNRGYNSTNIPFEEIK